MDEQDRKFWENVFVFALIALSIWVVIRSQNKNNQIVPPLPGGDPAPVVPKLPGLVAKLRSAKSLCESRGAAAIDLLREQPHGRVELARGRRLYDEAKAEFDGGIDHLRTGLSRRFVEADAAEVAAKLDAGQRKADAFVAWVNSLEPTTTYGAAGPLETLAQFVSDWMARANAQNEQALERLSANLEACRLREWNRLGQADGSSIAPAPPVGYGDGSFVAPAPPAPVGQAIPGEQIFIAPPAPVGPAIR